MATVFNAVNYGAGIDMGKDEFHVCLSAIDDHQRIKIRATRKCDNKPLGFAELSKWVNHHAKEHSLPIHYLMEATGVYYEHLGLCLHHRQAHLCVVLPQKSACYIKALGLKTKNDKVDAQALAMMACQQAPEAWQPISEAMYKLRQNTRQHAQIQDVKAQLSNQLHAIETSMYTAPLVRSQRLKLIAEIATQPRPVSKRLNRPPTPGGAEKWSRFVSSKG